MKLKPLQCPNCHAPVERIEGNHYMFCPYCGTKIVMDDIEFYKEDAETEREKIRADRDVEKSKNRSETIKEVTEGIFVILMFLLEVIFFIIIAAAK